jgi:hypothetical protein
MQVGTPALSRAARLPHCSFRLKGAATAPSGAAPRDAAFHGGCRIKPFRETRSTIAEMQSEGRCTTPSRRTAWVRRTTWPFSEPTLRSHPARPPGVFPTATGGSRSGGESGSRVSGRLVVVSMKKGRVSSDGWCVWIRDLAGVGGVEQRSCLYGHLGGGIRRNRMLARGRKSNRAVRPPDEKRRLWERTAGFERACARSRG